MIELLTIDGCPNEAPARELIGRVVPGADVRHLVVEDWDAARDLRFLGSPTIRVDGKDVEPGADTRETYVVACRVYPGGAGVPPEDWLRAALAQSS